MMSTPESALEPDRRLRTVAQGRYLFGGAPRRLLELTDAGRRSVVSWFTGRARPVSDAQSQLARRLVEAELAHPRRPPAAAGRRIDVVVPVFDDADGLSATLASLTDGRSPVQNRLRVIVVDDGSRVPVRLPASIDGVPVTVLRHRTNRGPAAARNSGLGAGDAPLVLFVDAGVQVAPGTVDELTGWLDDPLCCTAAPRIRSSPARGLVGRYELDHSPLDMGRFAGEPVVVGREGSVRYVPSTVLLVDRSAFAGAGGFDEDLRFGEDVDLVWRMGRSGWVVFDPALIAWHQPRRSILAFAQQRFAYGSSAGPLARRHGRALVPLVLSASVGVAGAAALTLPAGWVATATGAAVVVDARDAGRQLDSATDGWPGAYALGVVEVGRGWVASIGAVIGFMTRVGWPLTVVLLVQPVSRRLRQRTALTLAARAALAVRDAGVRPALLALVDDMAYGAGVWTGAVRSRQPEAILPRLLRKR